MNNQTASYLPALSAYIRSKIVNMARTVLSITLLAGSFSAHAILIPSDYSGSVLLGSGPSTSPAVDMNGPGYEASMGMNFTFFGTTYTGIYINSNGTLTFNSGRNVFDNYAFPISGTDMNSDRWGDQVPTIAPFFNAFDTDAYGYTLSYNNTQPDVFVASWDNMQVYDVSDRNSFQAILFGDNYSGGGFDPGTILFNYGWLEATFNLQQDYPGTVNTATIGLNNADGVNYATLSGLGIGDAGGLITAADFSSLMNSNFDPFLFTPDGHGGYSVTSVAYSDLPPIPGFTNSTSPVPEPETYSMLLAGLGLISFTALRRKQNFAV